MVFNLPKFNIDFTSPPSSILMLYPVSHLSKHQYIDHLVSNSNLPEKQMKGKRPGGGIASKAAFVGANRVIGPG